MYYVLRINKHYTSSIHNKKFFKTAKKRLWGFRIFLDNCTVGVDRVYDLKHSWVVSLDSETGVLINFQMKIHSIEIGKR